MGCRGIPNQYGGFEQFAQYLSAGLCKRGHDVWVYNSHRHPYRQNEWNGVHIVHCKDLEYKLGTTGQFIYDRNCIRDAQKRDFDVLLHLGYTSDSVWHHRWPTDAVNMINMDGLEWKRKKYNRLTRFFLKRAEKLAAMHGDVLVADSEAIQRYVKDTYGRESHFIPYAAEVFDRPDKNILKQFCLEPQEYYMLMARMVPENNIEQIIKGYLGSSVKLPLLIIGDMSNRFGKYIISKYSKPGIIYAGTVFDTGLLNNLRFYSRAYFHGHSVGGTNPSLLEAMASASNIIAHDNEFNRLVLGQEADYFFTDTDIIRLLNNEPASEVKAYRYRSNTEKIKTIYDPDKIIGLYESVMLHSLRR